MDTPYQPLGSGSAPAGFLTVPDWVPAGVKLFWDGDALMISGPPVMGSDGGRVGWYEKGEDTLLRNLTSKTGSIRINNFPLTISQCKRLMLEKAAEQWDHIADAMNAGRGGICSLRGAHGDCWRPYHGMLPQLMSAYSQIAASGAGGRSAEVQFETGHVQSYNPWYRGPGGLHMWCTDIFGPKSADWVERYSNGPGCFQGRYQAPLLRLAADALKIPSPPIKTEVIDIPEWAPQGATAHFDFNTKKLHTTGMVDKQVQRLILEQMANCSRLFQPLKAAGNSGAIIDNSSKFYILNKQYRDMTDIDVHVKTNSPTQEEQIRVMAARTEVKGRSCVAATTTPKEPDTPLGRIIQLEAKETAAVEEGERQALLAKDAEDEALKQLEKAQMAYALAIESKRKKEVELEEAKSRLEDARLQKKEEKRRLLTQAYEAQQEAQRLAREKEEALFRQQLAELEAEENALDNV